MLYNENKQHFYALGLTSGAVLRVKLYETDVPRIIQKRQILKGFNTDGNMVTINTSSVLYAEQLTDVSNVFVFNSKHTSIGQFNNVSNVRKAGKRLYFEKNGEQLSQEYDEPFTFKEKLILYKKQATQ